MVRLGWFALIAVIGCGGSSSSKGDDTPAGDDAPPIDSGPVSSCDPPGHFGAATTSFTLPTPSGSTTGFNYADVQAAFPAVDWMAIDRLYIPAGHYTNIELGNLPKRTADHPLVITNKGGQVVVGFNPHGNYIWAFHGGANWILTGRYDADSATGDEGFKGHACGNYGDSAGKYGIVSDDDYALSAPYLHMGIAVDGGATDFEIEYVEVARSGFAGIRLINDHTMDLPMRNVRVHDTYIHDTDGEGFYFGWTGAPPSNLLPGLQIYNNRLIRTGNEALQIQDLGNGSHVHHNTIISGGLHWFDNGLGRYQDSNSQVLTREGTIEFDHNVFIDGAGSLLSFFSSPETNDGDRHVTFHDNYFSDAADLGIYINGTSTASSSFMFEHNTFRGMDFAYGPIDMTDPDYVVGRNPPVMGAITFSNNTWSGTTRLVNGMDGGDAIKDNVTLTGNTMMDPGAIELVDEKWTAAGHHLTRYAPNITVNGGSTPATYHPGDVVSFGEAPKLYRATADTMAAPPGGAWTELGAGTDDVRVQAGSMYEGYGVQ
ncbi:MAG TPA: hypothetical protein VGM90_07755 [Kofleriaceae bacterium]|jgi:hypothetical protein